MSFFDLFKSKSNNSESLTPSRRDDYSLEDCSYEEVEGIENLPVTFSRQDNMTLAQIRNAGEWGGKIAEMYTENKRINSNIKALRIQTNASLKKHSQYMMRMREVIAYTFGERHVALNNHYAVLSRAIESNDRELIIASLQGISNIVVQNPLENLAKFAFALKNPDIPLELEF